MNILIFDQFSSCGALGGCVSMTTAAEVHGYCSIKTKVRARTDMIPNLRSRAPVRVGTFYSNYILIFNLMNIFKFFSSNQNKSKNSSKWKSVSVSSSVFITMNTHRPEDTAPHVDSFAAENSPQQVLKELGGGGGGCVWHLSVSLNRK